MPNAFLIDGVRTPIGSLGGSLSGVRADDLAAHAIAKLLERHPGLDPARITDVVMGCANQAGEDHVREPAAPYRVVDLHARGISETQADNLRARLKTFAQDWDRPEDSIYDEHPAR